ncbi:hypothetical protein GWK90_03980 [Candidatus Hamiltonella defensa]|uniref:Glycoside hydrolase family 42 N-terminal domain-containing protein n=1 Tax=Candidatus Williamhamiltonella defendens TaxID=138072 RepID=A0AAC9VJF2_9ENTR|nr:hypothetical protein [Candidatus Hamiltonella defensa]ASV34088.1 hypothetical protein CJJ18_09090 [Candidatus Hamiltonella defensa]AWK17048.1 hypothetical protein CCS40_08910 [Candidatus Hamiltonella defensa]MBK4361451.1 hypothetical protein [Candidatus Hamiltonella defensa]
MNILRFSFMLFTLTFTSFPVFSAPLKNYLYTSSGNLEKIKPLLIRPDIDGVQIVYNWNILEKQKNQYDFSEIEKDLEYVNKLHKNLFIQLQDRFFSSDAKNVPYYLLNEPVYKKGLVHQYDNPGENKPIASGWVAQQWNPEVQKRYQKLISELAKKFDGRIFGINLPETAIDIDIKKDTTGFTCEKYFNAEIENALFTRKAFKKSHVVQYINFWPCEWNNDHQYMSKFFALAEKNNIGLGGPDIIPNKKGHMKNAYPFFHQYKGKLGLVAMAVQEPTLTYTNPQTRRPFTKAEFTDYAENYLGADIIFWSLSSPWLDRQ